MIQMVTLTLTVTDDGTVDGATDMASVMITVLSGPAVSVETMDQTVPGGTVVNLLATSRSADVAGATRLWTATPNVGTFSNAAVEDATWTAPATTAATQVVTLTLTVTDSDDATGSASVTITVPGTDPTVSIQTADREVAGGYSIQLATSADVDTTREATAGTFVTQDSAGWHGRYPATGPPMDRHCGNVQWQHGRFVRGGRTNATWTAPGTTAAPRWSP